MQNKNKFFIVFTQVDMDPGTEMEVANSFLFDRLDCFPGQNHYLFTDIEAANEFTRRVSPVSFLIAEVKMDKVHFPVPNRRTVG